MPSRPTTSVATLAGMWFVGAAAYVVAIANRTSLSALGIDAAQHFSLDPATLSLFAVLQLAVYGVAQIPVGLALDRWGTRRVLSVGIVLMAVSQVALAVAPSAWLAIGARVFLGAGDATVFPSILRVIGLRFPRRIAPVVVQVTGLLGQFGQIISVIPFAIFVRAVGWSPGFLGLAATTALLTILTWVVMSDDGHQSGAGNDLRRRVRVAWANPGTRLAFWAHFTCPFAANAFGVLWGYPFLVRAEGLSDAAAKAILTVLVAFGLVAGPVVGALSARFAQRRIIIVLSVVAAQAITWGVVIALPGAAPTWLLVVLAAVICVGGPASVVSFDIARDHNPADQLSTATGIVNGAGFLATVIVVFGIGLILQVTSPPGGAYDLSSFRWAMMIQFPLWILGAFMAIRENRRIDRHRSPFGSDQPLTAESR